MTTGTSTQAPAWQERRVDGDSRIVFDENRQLYVWTGRRGSGIATSYAEARYLVIYEDMRRIALNRLRHLEPVIREDAVQEALLDVWNLVGVKGEVWHNDSFLTWRAVARALRNGTRMQKQNARYDNLEFSDDQDEDDLRDMDAGMLDEYSRQLELADDGETVRVVGDKIVTETTVSRIRAGLRSLANDDPKAARAAYLYASETVYKTRDIRTRLGVSEHEMTRIRARIREMLLAATQQPITG